ncbi:MAG: CoA-transferase [Dehalococcoidia bacterium]|nr:CoA-transferase [Dehalococcoidia bacterium]
MARPTIYSTMAEAVTDVPDGITLLVPGFGVGTPLNLLTALYHRGAKGITVVQNGQGNASTDERVRNTGNMIEEGRVKKVIASFTAAMHPSRASKTEQMVRDGLLAEEDDITFTSENGVIGYGRLATPEEGDPDVWNAGGQQVTLRPGASLVSTRRAIRRRRSPQ